MSAPGMTERPLPPHQADSAAPTDKRTLLGGRSLLGVLAVVALVLLLGYIIIGPMATVIWGAFRDGSPGTDANYTIAKFVETFESRVFARALRNTFIFGVGSSLVSFAIGGYFAWLTERTNIPFRNGIYVLVMVPLIIPGILGAIAWMLILNPTIGLANHFLEMFFGIQDPVFNSYTLSAMIWASGTDSITLPFLLMAAAFRTMDPSLEEASAVSGATYPQTVRRVTLPVLLPAMAAAFLLLFIRAIEDFNVPAAMGVPGRIPVLASEIWLAARRAPSDFNMAAAIGVLYLIVCLLGIAAYYYATRVGDRYVTVKGKAFRPTRIKLGRSRYVHTAIAWTLMLVAVILPFAVMVYAAFLPFYHVPGPQTFERLSFTHFEWILQSRPGRRALVNNLIVGIPAALVAMLLATVIAWITIRTRAKGRRLLDAVAFAPIAIPGMVMGLAFVWFFLSFPVVPIYGTLWIIGIAFVAKYIPYGMRAAHASLGQLDRELEEASQVSGASWARTLARIVLPLMSSGLLVGFIYILSLTFKVLSLPVLLAGPRTGVLSILVLDLYQNGEYARLNAVGVVMFVILVVLFTFSRYVSRRVGYVAESD